MSDPGKLVDTFESGVQAFDFLTLEDGISKPSDGFSEECWLRMVLEVSDRICFVFTTILLLGLCKESKRGRKVSFGDVLGLSDGFG